MRNVMAQKVKENISAGKGNADDEPRQLGFAGFRDNMKAGNG